MEPIGNQVDYQESIERSFPDSATEGVIQPQVLTEDRKYVGFWLRLVAYIIDGLISLVFFAVIVAILVYIFNISDISVFLRFILQLVGLLFWFVYYVFMTKKYGATLGKMAVGIVVISEKYEGLSWGQAIGREILKFVSASILYLGFIMAGFNKKKQALHDIIAKTLVVHKNF